ncbi:MAG: holin family protein [Pseudomonadota bacterium]
MGLMDRIFGWVFGGGRNAVVEVAEVFRENAEGQAVRAADLQRATIDQMAAEFTHPNKGGFDRFMDGINRIPRPALALGTLGLFVAAMADPDWFASRMAGLAHVPEPLWWLLGAIVSFYFGARHQMKGQEFQRAIATTLAIRPSVTASPDSPNIEPSINAAIDDWHRWKAHTTSQ